MPSPTSSPPRPRSASAKSTRSTSMMPSSGTLPARRSSGPRTRRAPSGGAGLRPSSGSPRA
eukprot:3891691-Alexandrium_andersonii.AAC.1